MSLIRHHIDGAESGAAERRSPVYNPATGAVQHEVEDRLSEKILHGELNSGDHVHVDYQDGEFVFTTTKRELPVGVGVNANAAIGTGPQTPDLAASGD